MPREEKARVERKEGTWSCSGVPKLSPPRLHVLPKIRPPSRVFWKVPDAVSGTSSCAKSQKAQGGGEASVTPCILRGASRRGQVGGGQAAESCPRAGGCAAGRAADSSSSHRLEGSRTDLTPLTNV